MMINNHVGYARHGDRSPSSPSEGDESDTNLSLHGGDIYAGLQGSTQAAPVKKATARAVYADPSSKGAGGTPQKDAAIYKSSLADGDARSAASPLGNDSTSSSANGLAVSRGDSSHMLGYNEEHGDPPMTRPTGIGTCSPHSLQPELLGAPVAKPRLHHDRGSPRTVAAADRAVAREASDHVFSPASPVTIDDEDSVDIRSVAQSHELRSAGLSQHHVDHRTRPSHPQQTLPQRTPQPSSFEPGLEVNTNLHKGRSGPVNQASSRGAHENEAHQWTAAPVDAHQRDGETPKKHGTAKDHKVQMTESASTASKSAAEPKQSITSRMIHGINLPDVSFSGHLSGTAVSQALGPYWGASLGLLAFLAVSALCAFFILLSCVLSQIDLVGGACYTFWGYKSNCDTVRYDQRPPLMLCRKIATRLEAGAAFSIMSLVGMIFVLFFAGVTFVSKKRHFEAVSQAQALAGVRGAGPGGAADANARARAANRSTLGYDTWNPRNVELGAATEIQSPITFKRHALISSGVVLILQLISWSVIAGIYSNRFCELPGDPRTSVYGVGFGLNLTAWLMQLLVTVIYAIF